MSLTQKTVLTALRQVTHPETGQSLVDLGLVKDIHVVDGQVEVVLALGGLPQPVRDHLADEARSAITALPEAEAIAVRLTEEGSPPPNADRPAPQESMNQVGHVVAVMSGKGGVGKSLVTALLAIGLTRQGKRVGILDADITGPSIPKLFGLHGRPEFLPQGIVPARSSTGIEVMSVNLLLESEDEAVIWRGPMIHNLISQFWTDVTWGEIDYLLVDLPPGTADAPLSVMQVLPLDGVLLVTTPQDLAAMVVRKALRMAEKMNVPLLGMVENMSYYVCPETGVHHEIFGPSGAAALAKEAGTSLLARLPVDPLISRLCDAGEIETYQVDAIAALAGALAQLTAGGRTTTFEKR